ncbi:hypothetical protein BCR36DRAFT_582574 [Piromyces finnis]|uniref:Uncharacterized protein n=1 Tax=Piromyces finnis TaxID=1754191 RepID=A0A1Y1VDN0_9FUNG|nr:hypothetical protein BCR36DRAFT_582574 [Piromyces finnis]|eukprot:ORX52640.1 hypothetical protein BCR36DRAFT_582574 [Piromyces finnis]
MSSFLILYLVAVALTALGFIKFMWFLSLGYAFSVVAMGIANLIIFRNNLTLSTAILNVLFIVYGCRLGSFLYIREGSSSYINKDKNKQEEEKPEKPHSLVSKISIWLPCAFIYVCEVSPVLFRLQNGAFNSILIYIGIVISCLGIFFEGVGDYQKFTSKKKNPTRFCDIGLYKIVRCPNYLGEILFWTGIFVSGINALQGVWQWLAACFGYVCIVFIMISAASSLDKKQKRNYAENNEFQTYASSTPLLIPFAPVSRK